MTGYEAYHLVRTGDLIEVNGETFPIARMAVNIRTGMSLFGRNGIRHHYTKATLVTDTSDRTPHA